MTGWPGLPCPDPGTRVHVHGAPVPGPGQLPAPHGARRSCRAARVLYALLQGYDAVHLRADVQLGATEQLFNIMAGAKLQEASGQPPCVALTFPVLVGTDGTDRMSKSRGNYIGLTDSPGEQFGKVMSIPDQAMPQWVRLVTDSQASQAEELIASMAGGALHPMEAKKQLGHRIVELYHGSRAADAAQHAFERTHQLGEQADFVPEVTLHGPVRLGDLLVGIGAASSKSDAPAYRRPRCKSRRPEGIVRRAGHRHCRNHQGWLPALLPDHLQLKLRQRSILAVLRERPTWPGTKGTAPRVDREADDWI